MSRNDLILTLVRAGAAGDKALLQSTVEALAADERSKNHTTLADRLTRAAKSNGVPSKMTFYGGGAPISDGHEFIVEMQPRRQARDRPGNAHAPALKESVFRQHRMAERKRHAQR